MVGRTGFEPVKA